MLELNQSHPDFDLGLEILCTLKPSKKSDPSPCWHSFGTLMTDFGIDEMQLQSILTSLKNRRFAIRLRVQKVCMGYRRQNDQISRALRYWDNVVELKQGESYGKDEKDGIRSETGNVQEEVA